MDRKNKGTNPENPDERLTPGAPSRPASYQPEQEDAQYHDVEEQFHDAAKEEETEDGEGGEQGGDSGGGGVIFDETETDFDQTELQGMQLPSLRKAIKKGLKLFSRVTKESEQYLKNFLPDKDLRSRVVEIAISRRGHPTLLLDKGEIVQYQLSRGKLDRVRVSPDLEAEQAVRYAMAGFIAAGESINPKHVKFGRSPEFEARMKPVWVQEWKRMQREEKALHMNVSNRNISFRRAVEAQAQPAKAAPGASAAKPQTVGKPRIDIPRSTVSSRIEPKI